MSFQLSGQTRAFVAVLKISTILPKYPTKVHMVKVSAHCIVASAIK